MAALTHSGSRSLYSWWWDSHISPKNSKWLQENLTDMDARVKAMIKLIEEDADSFARRAEMYYKKRPELMKLLEEIYRAYRALAERYDYATVELRQAHRTMAEVFPNQVPYDLIDESPSESSVSGPEQPPTPELFHGISKRGRGQVDEDGSSRSSSKNQNLEGSGDSSEAQVEDMEEVLTKIEAEKESIFLEYQQAIEELSKLETELKNTQQEAAGLDQRASKAEIEVKILKEALSGMEAERNANLPLYNQSLETISKLKSLLSLSQEEVEALDMRACKAKTESQYLRLQVSSLESEKEASVRQYKQCLEKISLMEAKISAAEENLDSALVKCSRLEDSNRALQLEANDLMEEIAMKDQEHARRQVEFEKFQIQMHNEQSLFKQVETSLHTLQDLHSRSRDEQKALALELKNSRRMLKDLSIHRVSVEEELRKVKEENRQLGLDAEELQRQRNYLENEFKLLKQELGSKENEKHDLQETMKQLVFEATQKEQHEKFLAGEIQMQNLNLENLRRDYLVLQRENSDLINVKRSELEKFSDLKDAYHGLKEENRILIEQAVALDVFSLVFESFTAAKAMEIKALNQDLDRLLLANRDLKNTAEELAEALVMKETEILRLNNLVEKLDSDLHEAKKHNDLLVHEIVLGNNFLRQKVEGLSETEQELKDSQQFNAKLCNRVEELKMECKELTLIRENLEIENLQLCIDGHRQNEEISWLLETNENLKSEVDLLYNEVEECRIREVELSSEIQERRAGFELWEAKAASINFDLQASSDGEVFLENKLHEITQACKKIEGESAGKDMEIHSLRESYRILQSETEKLKPEFSATFFDQNSTKGFGNGTQMKDIPLDHVSGFSIYGRSKKESREANDQTVEPMTDQSFIAGESHNPTFLPLLSNPNVGEEKNHSGSSLDIEREPVLGDARFERSSSIRERSQGGKKRKILQRLASDAQKLTILRTTVDDLNKRMETKKWSKKESYIEHEKVCKQLREVEETVLHLVNTNGQLTRNVEQSPSSLAGKTASELEIENGARNNMMEQTRKASEKIGRLHLEVQNIGLVLHKMEEEKKRKWKTRFAKNKTGIILKDFIYNGKKSSEKEKKSSFWGCQRPPRNED